MRDYTDEEIRREVRNYGVTENPVDKTLRLEEKGTVYNEMVSSMDRPNYRIFRAMDQWFIEIDHKDFRKRALAEIERVQWVPDWGKSRIEAAVKGRPDWCISRQRTWGVPPSLNLAAASVHFRPPAADEIELLRRYRARERDPRGVG